MNQRMAMSGLECIDALKRVGYEVEHSSGAHQILRHPEGKAVIVPMFEGENLSPALLRSIFASTGLASEELVTQAAWEEGELRMVVPSDHPVAAIMPKLLAEHPLHEAMASLSGPAEPSQAITNLAAEAASRQPAIIQAAIWYYADDLDRSHNISQNIEGQEGAYWHGLMHRREGDFWNAKYWFRRAGTLPGKLGLDPMALTDKIAALKTGENPAELVDAQRREWLVLFEHCLRTKP